MCYQWIILSPCRFAASRLWPFLCIFNWLPFCSPASFCNPSIRRWHLLRPFQTMRSAIRPSNCDFVLQFILLPDSVHRSKSRILRMFVTFLLLLFASLLRFHQIKVKLEQIFNILFVFYLIGRFFAPIRRRFFLHGHDLCVQDKSMKIRWNFIRLNESERNEINASKQTHFWVL